MTLTKTLIMSSLLLCTMSTKSFGTNHLSLTQISNLKIGHEIGSLMIAKDGLSFEKTICSIILTESSANNRLVGDSGKSFGLMQVQVATVREVAKKVPTLRWLKAIGDKQVKRMLVNNNIFNVLIGSNYLRLNYNLSLKRGYENPYFKTISRYNGGWYNTGYFKRVMVNMKKIQMLIKLKVLT